MCDMLAPVTKPRGTFLSSGILEEFLAQTIMAKEVHQISLGRVVLSRDRRHMALRRYSAARRQECVKWLGR